MKKLVSVALAATMVLGLAGCNDGSSQTAATTAPAAEAAGTEAAGAESGAPEKSDGFVFFARRRNFFSPFRATAGNPFKPRKS